MMSTYGGDLYAEVLVGIQGPPSVWYLALLNTIPSPGDTGTDISSSEPVGSSYSRVLISAGSGSWAAASDGMCMCTDPITYSPTENWGIINAYALCTAVTGGQVLFYDYLLAPITIKAGATVTIPAGSLGIGVVV